MFGHDDDKDDTQKNDDDSTVIQPVSTQPPDEKPLGVNDDDGNADDATNLAVPPAPDSSDDGDIKKIVNNINATTEENDTPGNVAVTDLDDSSPTVDNEAPSELTEIRKSALKELSPLLDELDQTPEDKLDILMMSIQASDDQALIPKAFETAKKIEDKKQRAEAMLDIINEINYFTKKSK